MAPLCLAAFILVMGALTVRVRAQDGITVTRDEHEHVFKEAITLRLAASSTSAIDEVRLFYRVSGQTSSNKVVLEFEPDTTVEVEHVLDMSDPDNYQPPMVTFTYWWVIEDQADNRLKTEPSTFVYTDTRYDWQVLKGEQVWLYWHDQREEFGQGYFELATGAAQELSADFGVQPEDPVSIAIYNSHEELMSVLQEASAEWTGAVTFGDSGIIAIGLGSTAWMELVIPHELTHAMLSQVTRPPFGQLPRWLEEGLAVRSEGGSSGEEVLVLQRAIEDNDLISLRVLNSAFADQRERAVLSYAESYSLIEFIIAEYGAHKLGELIAVFAEGAHYDDAMMQVFGVDMDGMEDLWREYIGAAPREGVTRATPVPTATFAPSPTPTEAAQPPGLTPTLTATAVAAVPTATATPVVADLTATPTPQPRVSRGPCLGAAPALVLVGLFVVFRPRSTR